MSARIFRAITIGSPGLPAISPWLDPSIADALLDRVVHTVHKIVLRGESMRKLRAKRRT
jgi:hypothetical protein